VRVDVVDGGSNGSVLCKKHERELERAAREIRGKGVAGQIDMGMR
jgi:hypothetical protein